MISSATSRGALFWHLALGPEHHHEERRKLLRISSVSVKIWISFDAVLSAHTQTHSRDRCKHKRMRGAHMRTRIYVCTFVCMPICKRCIVIRSNPLIHIYMYIVRRNSYIRTNAHQLSCKPKDKISCIKHTHTHTNAHGVHTRI